MILDQGFKNNLYIVAQTGDNPYNKLNLLALLFMITVLIKYLISLGPYCGQNTPPNYGDYEAQRHWMEITFHTPP